MKTSLRIEVQHFLVFFRILPGNSPFLEESLILVHDPCDDALEPSHCRVHSEHDQHEEEDDRPDEHEEHEEHEAHEEHEYHDEHEEDDGPDDHD